VDVLFEENNGKNEYRGYGANYIDLCVMSDVDIIGQVLQVKVDKTGCNLVGHRLEL